MAYTLYIGDDGTYTQKEFATLKEIAQWSVGSALDAPVESTHVLYISDGADIYKRKQFPSLADLARWAVCEALEGDDSTDSSVKVEKEKEKEKEKVTEIVQPNYGKLADSFLDEAFNTAFCAVPASGDAPISDEDVNLFLRILARHPQVAASTFLTSDSGINWASLPAEFIVELQPKAAAYVHKRGPDSCLVAAHPTTIETFKIIHAFRSWHIDHKSWGDYTLSYKGQSFTPAGLNNLMNILIGEWLCNAPVSDELHELMIKLITFRFLMKTIPDATMGSQDFLSYYHNKLNSIFQSSFYLWVIRGSHYRHCKKALEDIGISQVRRAGGQKFIGIQEVGANVPMQYITDLHPIGGQETFYSSMSGLGRLFPLEEWAGDCTIASF